jgi:hypothetical protein
MANERKVVQDISKASFTAPSAGGGASLPGLSTRTTTARSMNNALEGLAGFSKTIAQLGLIREKNSAAAEALQAKNDALAGKFSTFDRKASVDLYDQTRGDIKGRSASLSIGEQLQAVRTDILNQNLSIDDSLKAFDEAKSQIMQDNFAGHLQQSEAYKSGFLPHAVNTIEKNRVALAEAHQLKFNAERKADQSEFATSIVGQTKQFGPDKGVHFEDFAAIRKAGVNMGMTREDATTNAIDTIGLIAVGEGKPWLLKFGDEAGPDGFKVSNNPDLKKRLLEYKTKAQAQFIGGEKLRIANEAREKAEKEQAALDDGYDAIIKSPSEDHSGLIKDISSLGYVDGQKIAALSNFAHNARNGDRDIAPNNIMLVDTKLKIARGEITKVGELVKLYNESAKSKQGINKSGFDDLHAELVAHQSREGAVNSFSTNRDSIKNIFGDDKNLMDNVSGFGIEKRANAKRIQTFSLRIMDQSLEYFRHLHPDEPLSGPIAGKFFFTVRRSLEARLENFAQQKVDQQDLGNLGIGFKEDGSLDTETIDKLRTEDTRGILDFSDKPLELPKKIQEALVIDESDGQISLLEKYEDSRARRREKLKESEEFLTRIGMFANGLNK